MRTLFPTVLAAWTTWITGCAYAAPFRKTALAREGTLAPGQTVLMALTATEHRPGKRGEFFKDTGAVLDDLRG